MLPAYLSPLSVSDHVRDEETQQAVKEGVYGPSRGKAQEGREMWMYF